MDFLAKKCLVWRVLFAGGLAGAILPGGAAPLPAPWIARDAGAFSVPGFAERDGAGRWRLTASHGETPAGQDSFFLVYQRLSGNGSVVSLLLGQEGGNPTWGRAGISILEEAAPNARGAHFSMSSGPGLTFSYRRRRWGAPITEAGALRFGPRRFPAWLRLQREGDRLTPFFSEDGFGWTQVRAPLLLPGLAGATAAGLSVASNWGGPVTGFFGSSVVTPGLVSPTVQVSARNGAVVLGWPPVAGASGYLVRRTTPDLPGFAADLVTPAPLRETSFVDSGLDHSRPVRYLISALFGSGGAVVEGWATAVKAVPLGLPIDLTGSDLSLEAPHLQGGVTFDPATTRYRITGAGGGFNGAEDHGYFASRSVTGEFQVTARILERPVGVAGLMVRETLQGSSRRVFLGGTARDGLLLQSREQTGTAAYSFPPLLSDTQFRPPLYLRLVRRGDTITPFLSRDGVTFARAGGSVTFAPPLAGGLHVGYAITSQDAGAMAAGEFSDLTIGTP